MSISGHKAFHPIQMQISIKLSKLGIDKFSLRSKAKQQEQKPTLYIN